MVMATGSICQPYGRAAGDLSREAREASGAGEAGPAGEAADAAALHERLVAYVHALAGGHEPRSGVWVEHSYARARGAGSAQAAAHVRVLLAPRPAPAPDVLDVERVSPPPPSPPAPAAADSDPDEPDERDSDDWEARVLTLAPSAAHARLADHALDALRRMRLARLAAHDAFARHEAARAAARRLRLALAPACAQPARPAAWLHGALLAHMPRSARRLYDALTLELRRSAPRLAARLLGARAAPVRVEAGARAAGGAGPLLLWVGGGRWARRLGALVGTRVLAAGAAETGAPEAWCAAVVASVRAALADALAEAGERAVFVGGAGAGAALAAALAGAPRLRGLLLLAPPLLTLAGERHAPDDPLAELRLPMLLVAGTGAAQCWRGAARELARGEAGARRLLELRGADDALRLPAALRRRLPQHALDAAVADECARWMIEIAESSNGESPPRERVRRRGASPTPGAGRRAALEVERPHAPADEDEDDYAHLPSAASSRPVETDSDRPVEMIAEFSGRRSGPLSLEATSVSLGAGRVVSRGPGGTPLALLPPRREPGPALAAADIMRLPVVFADDAAGVTVTAGRRARYTRVIVASRGRGGGAAGGASGGAGARPVLLRRGVRLLRRVPRLDQH